MTEVRNSKGHFAKGNVPWNKGPDNKRSENMANLRKLKVIGEGLVKLERCQVICPVCGQQVEAVATDGRIKGYCAVANQHVDFLIETQLAPQTAGNPVTAETRAKLSAARAGKHHTAETKAKISAAITRWHNKKRFTAREQ